jgi:hypothetical protein
MTTITGNYAVRTELPTDLYDGGESSVESKVIDFWKKFNTDLKTYVEQMADDSLETVEILGHKVKKDSAAATYLADKWNNDTLSVIDRMLANIKLDIDLANKLFSMFS